MSDGASWSWVLNVANWLRGVASATWSLIAVLSEKPLFVATVQLAVGVGVAYLFAERWQRWRQRRDFQYHTMSRLSEISSELHSRFQELYALRIDGFTMDFWTKFRECNARRPQLFALKESLLRVSARVRFTTSSPTS